MSADTDHELLSHLPKGKLVNLLRMHARNVLRIDGLYFLGIEEKFGTCSAIEIDRQCWKTMGAIEAHEIKKLMRRSRFTVPKVMQALQLSSWSLYHTDKEVDEKKGVFRVVRCKTQLTRLKKGLPEFPCKTVRYEYLRAFASELSPQIEVVCRICPPDRDANDSWCEWEFKIGK